MGRGGAWLVAVAFLAVGLAMSTTVAQARARGAGCVLQHGTLLDADGQAAVYTIRVKVVSHFIESEHQLGTQVSRTRQTRGCVVGHKRSYALWEEAVPESLEPEGSVSMFTLAGSIVAYKESLVLDEKYGGEGADYVVVRNLLTGRVIHSVPAATPELPGDDGGGFPTQIVARSDGSVAWIAMVFRGPSYSQSYEVHAVGKSGDRVLASGTDINPRSLTLVGSMLSWQQGGELVSVVLD